MLAIDLFSCLLFVCFLSTAGAGDECVNEWLGPNCRCTIWVPPKSNSFEFISPSVSGWKLPKPKSERNFQNPFSRLFGFFWVGGPEVFSRFFHKGARVGLRQSQRYSAAVRIQKVVRGAIARMQLQRRSAWENQPQVCKGGKIYPWSKDSYFKESSQILVFFFWNP